jgi:Probable transposase.
MYNQDDPNANPPGYRKHGDEHPRSTVTWKNNGFKLDTQYNRVRLSKGTNMKPSRYAADYILCEYTIQADDQTLEDVGRHPDSAFCLDRRPVGTAFCLRNAD